MNNILLALPLFAPSLKQLERNINSIQTVGNYLKECGTDGLNVTVVFGGWAYNDTLWNRLIEAIKLHIHPNTNVIRFDKNYGKAVVVNKLVAIAAENAYKFDFILTADSDILFPLESKHMFLRLVSASQTLAKQKGKPTGLIALNQIGANCHWKVCYENAIEYDNKILNNIFHEKIVWPSAPSGIAGGCLFFTRQAWDAVRGYPVSGVYSGDDAVILLNIPRAGYTYQLIDTLGIVHPSDDDAEYAEFKRMACHRDTMSGPKATLDPIINEFNEYWKAKREREGEV